MRRRSACGRCLTWNKRIRKNIHATSAFLTALTLECANLRKLFRSQDAASGSIEHVERRFEPYRDVHAYGLEESRRPDSQSGVGNGD
jgi:hypothetical protein